jgi:hypothetical protein
MLILATGHEVNGFTLDTSIGEFILTHPRMSIPQRGKMYSINEGNSEIWNDATAKYVSYCKSSSNGHKPYTLRYIGAFTVCSLPCVLPPCCVSPRTPRGSSIQACDPRRHYGRRRTPDAVLRRDIHVPCGPADALRKAAAALRVRPALPRVHGCRWPGFDWHRRGAGRAAGESMLWHAWNCNANRLEAALIRMRLPNTTCDVVGRFTCTSDAPSLSGRN